MCIERKRKRIQRIPKDTKEKAKERIGKAKERKDSTKAQEKEKEKERRKDWKRARLRNRMFHLWFAVALEQALPSESTVSDCREWRARI